MKKTLLGCALVGALGLAHIATAQDFDDRWYLTGTAGVHVADGDRNVHDGPIYGLGFGRFLSPNVSIDVDVNGVSPDKNGSQLHWNNYGPMVTGRYHFIQDGRSWNPYFAFGAGVLKHEEEHSDPLGGKPFTRRSNNLAAQLGLGIQSNFDRLALRTEVLGRFDADDESVAAPRERGFIDLIGQVSLLVKLGDPPAPPVVETAVVPPPPPPPPSCADLDDDGDGVNNCDDRCPDTKPGQIVGPDGCPVAISIDLRGVNFDFDKATLRPDAVETLNEAVSLLTQYPELSVEVAGHTDLCGAEGYNQSLSERRAKTVYDYLNDHGIAASRLVGPTGYGESRPLEPTAQTFPACKSEVNRRTELNVQN